MPDLIVYLPNHGYSDDDLLFVSWLNGTYYVEDKLLNSFKLSTVPSSDGSHPQCVQYETSITSGYVRKMDISGSTVIDGLDHLEGESVTLTSGGVNYGSFTVADGAINAPVDLYTCQVGIPYAMKIKTTRLAVTNLDGTQARIKRIAETVVRHVRTKGGQAGQEYKDTEYLTDMNAVFSVKSEDSPGLTKGGFSTDGYTVVRSNEPYPATILATIVSVEVAEK